MKQEQEKHIHVQENKVAIAKNTPIRTLVDSRTQRLHAQEGLIHGRRHDDDDHDSKVWMDKFDIANLYDYADHERH